MKNILIGATLCTCLGAAPALAGSVADPIVEPSIIVEDVKNSSVSGGAIVAMMAALLLSVPLGK